MNTKKVLLVKYGEISLRKGNRAFFEHALLDTIRRNLKPINDGNLRVSREQGRFLIENTTGDLDTTAVLPRIRHIFGIAAFCHAVKTSARDIADLAKIGLDFFSTIVNAGTAAQATSPDGKTPPREYSASDEWRGLPVGAKPATPAPQEPTRLRDDATPTTTCPRSRPPQAFKVATKRSDKKYPLTSMQISAAIGEAIFFGLNLPVDLHKPDITLWVEIRNDVYFYVNSEKGEGGLPYGASGKGVLLLSGGFDSPVAGYLAARRGVEIVAAYFHSPPFVSERAADKVRDLIQALEKYTSRIKLCIIPFTEIQLFLKQNVSEAKLTIYLKRAMLHIASRLAERENALCLITGDSIGQVASQTIHSLAAMDSAATLPVLRPLAAMDKQQIIDIANTIGTYDISVRPYEDCCTVFVAKHPENKPNKAAIEKHEARFIEELFALVDKALDSAV